MKRGKSEAYIQEAADVLMKTGTICIASLSGVTNIDYFHGTREQAVARIKEALKQPLNNKAL